MTLGLGPLLLAGAGLGRAKPGHCLYSLPVCGAKVSPELTRPGMLSVRLGVWQGPGP